MLVVKPSLPELIAALWWLKSAVPSPAVLVFQLANSSLVSCASSSSNPYPLLHSSIDWLNALCMNIQWGLQEISHCPQTICLYSYWINALCPGSFWYKIFICPWPHVHQHSKTINDIEHIEIWECKGKKNLIHWQFFSISPLVHLKNEQGDWISTNDTTHPGGHSYPVHVLTLCWLFKRNLHVEGSLWNGPYYYLWSRERPCELF